MAKTVRDLMELLDISHANALRGLREGRLPGVQAVPGGTWRIPDEAFETLKRGVYKPEDFIRHRPVKDQQPETNS